MSAMRIAKMCHLLLAPSEISLLTFHLPVKETSIKQFTTSATCYQI